MNTKLTWVIQDNLGASEDIGKLKDFIKVLGYGCRGIKVVPFDDTPPSIEVDGKVIFYGSTTLVKNVAAAKKWTPGVWFNPQNYEFQFILNGFGKENLLNGDSALYTVQELLDNNLFSNDEMLFVRPAADLKEFAGFVSEYSEIKDRFKFVGSSNGPLSFDTVVQVAAPKNIESEYRTFVVDGRVVTYSQYKYRGNLCMKGELPSQVIEFAKEMALKHQPEQVYTLDVCEMSNGSIKVIETNTFNCSGLYWCDLHKLVSEVSNFAATHP